MSEEFAALVGSIGVGVPGVHACLLVSSDDLALATHPPAEEERALAVWLRLAALGDLDRGFVVVGDETWAFFREGGYGALAIAGTNVRPGVLLDRLEQVVAAAVDIRERREALTGPGAGLPGMAREAARAGGTRRFRLPLHREQAMPSLEGEDPDGAEGPESPARTDRSGVESPAPAAEPVGEDERRPVFSARMAQRPPVRDEPAAAPSGGTGGRDGEEGPVVQPDVLPPRIGARPGRRLVAPVPTEEPAGEGAGGTPAAGTPADPPAGGDGGVDEPAKPASEGLGVDLVSLAREFSGLLADTEKRGTRDRR